MSRLWNAIGISSGAVFLVLLWSLWGCASSPVSLTFAPAEGNFLTGEKVRLQEIRVDPRLYARGCIALEVIKDGGEVRLAIQQDGTSDFAVGRALPGVVREAVTGIMGIVYGPLDLLKAALGVRPAEVPPPSEIRGCAGLFVED